MKENAVFNVLLRQQMGKTPTQIAKLSGVPRSTAVRILERLWKRELVILTKNPFGKKSLVWRYKKGLEGVRIKQM